MTAKKTTQPAKTGTKVTPKNTESAKKPAKTTTPVEKTKNLTPKKSEISVEKKTPATKKVTKVAKLVKAKKEIVPKVSKRDVASPLVIQSARVEKPTHGALYVRSRRHFFTEDRSIVEMPQLIAAQLDSYSSFIDHGLQEALESVFPVFDFSEERVEIHFK